MSNSNNNNNRQTFAIDVILMLSNQGGIQAFVTHAALEAGFMVHLQTWMFFYSTHLHLKLNSLFIGLRDLITLDLNREQFLFCF